MSKQITVTLPDPLGVDDDGSTGWPGDVSVNETRRYIYIPGTLATPREARTLARSALAAADFIEGIARGGTNE